MREDVQKIFLKSKPKKQVLMFTATLSEKMKETALKYMRAPYHVIFIDDQKRLTLHGLKQYYAEVNEKQKFKYLYGILSKVDYNQCIIFTSKVDRAKYLNKMLKDVDISSLTIHADMNQKQRIENFQKFKDGSEKVLVATNLFARGIDIEQINLVINYDMSESTDTYLHRVGRAGRYNTKGTAITFVNTEEDKKILEDVQKRFEVKIEQLPPKIDETTFGGFISG
jgi:ATP-dependent RNA helicase UAP56/SUB2